jgi:hypothetical protein
LWRYGVDFDASLLSPGGEDDVFVILGWHFHLGLGFGEASAFGRTGHDDKVAEKKINGSEALMY